MDRNICHQYMPKSLSDSELSMNYLQDPACDRRRRNISENSKTSGFHSGTLSETRSSAMCDEDALKSDGTETHLAMNSSISFAEDFARSLDSSYNRNFFFGADAIPSGINHGQPQQPLSSFSSYQVYEAISPAVSECSLDEDTDVLQQISCPGKKDFSNFDVDFSGADVDFSGVAERGPFLKPAEYESEQTFARPDDAQSDEDEISQQTPAEFDNSGCNAFPADSEKDGREQSDVPGPVDRQAQGETGDLSCHSPYLNLDDAFNTSNIIGPPRCIALKNKPDANDESLIIDLEDDEVSLGGSAPERMATSDTLDMFCDREEGELSPDLGAPHAKTSAKRGRGSAKSHPPPPAPPPPVGNDPDSELFKSVDERMFQLDKECEYLKTRTASQNTIDQLKKTLESVEKMKSKLRGLMSGITADKKSDKTERRSRKRSRSRDRDRRRRRRKGSSRRRSRSARRRSASNSRASRSSRRNRSKGRGRNARSRARSDRKNRSRSPLRRNRSTDDDGKEKNPRKSSELKPKNECEKALCTRRMAMNLANPFTSEEKIRISSLFKRQMNLITQQINQEQTTKKIKHPAESNRHSKKSSNKSDKSVKKDEALAGLNSLEEMQAFIHSLKEKKQGVLKFTTKKEKVPRVDKDIDNFKMNESFSKKVNEQTTPNKSTEKYSPISKRKPAKQRNDDMIKLKGETIANPNVTFEKEDISKKEETVSDEHKSVPHENINLVLPKPDGKEAEFHNSTPCSGQANPLAESDRKIDTSLKKRKIERFSEHGSNESDIEAGIRIPKKKNKVEIHSSGEMGEDWMSGVKSGARCRSGNSNKMNDLAEDLRNQRVVIYGNKKLALQRHRFCLKVVGNQVFLKKVRKGRRKREERLHYRIVESRKPRQKREVPGVPEGKTTTERDAKSPDRPGDTSTLEEMEGFLRELRRKRESAQQQEEDGLPPPPRSQQSREVKFMARIQAKRKAKLMACLTNSTEKEAKFLKALEKGNGEPCDSPGAETKKQKLMQKIRAETDAIVLAQEQNSGKKKTQQQQQQNASGNGGDPLVDVKTLLNVIRQAEDNCEGSSKQVYVSFSLKKSDVRQLESLTNENGATLCEESQKILNNVRAKMKSKKVPVGEAKPE